MIIKPVRIQRSRQHKQVSPNGLPIVYVGRPSKWGNPYKPNSHDTINDCIKKYEEDIKRWHSDELKELSGKNLSCWCGLGEPCHADILLKIANK